MNILECYIQPGWTVKSFTEYEKEQMGCNRDLDWIHVDGKIDCYGAINYCRLTWIRSDWEQAVKRGYYMG